MYTPTTLAQEATLVYDLRCKPTTFSILLQDNLLALIETIGREQDVLLSTETLTVESVSTRFEELIATISVEGRYESVMRTFELLALLPYETRIQSANLQQTANNWRAVFDMRILKFKSI